MDMNKVAAQMYTIRDFCKSYETVDQSLAKLKAIGYKAVQVSGVSGVSDQEMRQLADKHGIVICATHVGFEPFDVEKIVEKHQILGCKYAGLGSMPEKFRSSKEGYITFIQEYNQIAAALYEKGLQLIYHNHNFEFQRFGDTTGIQLLFDRSCPEFGFETDTYWVQSGGSDPVKWIRKMDQKLKVVHLKDMMIVNGEQKFAEIGYGNLDWKEILKACEEIGVEWYCIEQDVCPGDPFESLKMSFDFLANFK